MQTSPCRNAQFITEEMYKYDAGHSMNTVHWTIHTGSLMLRALIYPEANMGGSFRAKQSESKEAVKSLSFRGRGKTLLNIVFKNAWPGVPPGEPVFR